MGALVFSSIAPDFVATWLTPVWILSLGVLGGMLVVAMLGLLVRFVGPMLGTLGKRAASELGIMLGEGFLYPVTLILGGFCIFALLGYFIAHRPGAILQSISRLHAADELELVLEAPPATRDAAGEIILEEETALPITSVRSNEVMLVSIASDQRLTLSPRPLDVASRRVFESLPNSPDRWNRAAQTEPPWPQGEWDAVHVLNYSDTPAQIKLVVVTRPIVPEVVSIRTVAICVIAIYLLYFLHRVFTPRLAAVALSTFKSEFHSPLFLLLAALGVFTLILFVFIPYNTFGEDIKMLKDTGLTLILVLSIIQAIWSASTSVSVEIEGKTALTVLSKPIDRRTFLIGKFVGVGWTVTLMFLILSIVLLLNIAYKPIYDARENSAEAPMWETCHLEVIQTVPGLALMLMETLLLTALSIALSTRLPLAPNVMICFAVYVLGHLTPLLVQTSSEGFEVVSFFARLLATAVPVLVNFNITPAIAGGREVPMVYLFWSSIYCFIYTVIALLLALLMFEDRDLA